MGSANSNRLEGKFFEELFKKRAQMNGLLARKNHLTAIVTGFNGRVNVVKSELDFTLINQDGRCGFFDCKSFGGDRFSHSFLNPKQIERAVLYNDWNVPSGFVFYFRKTNQIVFYSGKHIESVGPKNSFGPEDGQLLGRAELFDLKPLLFIAQ